MKFRSFFYTILLAALAVSATSCSKDDDGGDPAGTITLNMMNEDNGMTYLGDTGVYINKARNFTTGSWYCIASLGAKSGLSSILLPELRGTSSAAAVEPGSAYQIFRKDHLKEFPSGNKAVVAGVEYYNVFAVSNIEQEGAVVGTVVKYTSNRTPEYDLPEYNSAIGPLTFDGDELEIKLSTSDFEYVSESTQRVSHRKEGNKLIATLVDHPGYAASYGIYIRIKSSYTYVIVNVK